MRILAVFLFLLTAWPAIAQSLPEDFRGGLVFDAPTYAHPGEFRAGRSQSGKASLTLHLPAQGGGPFPAVIVGHSIGGWRDGTEGRYMQALLQAGYAVAGLDHFGPRGIARAADVPGAFNPITSASDALLALRLLATHPRIRADRIGVAGPSMGGLTAELSAYEFVRRKVLGDAGLKFAAHVAFYAPCQFYFSDDGPPTTGAPMLLLYAGKDETTPADKCDRIAALVRTAQPGLVRETHWYPEAHHAWELPFAPRLFPHHVNARKCPVIDFGVQGMRFLDGDGTARPFNGTELQACMRESAGYSMGHNASAAADAPQRMLAFFDRHLRN